MFQNLPSIISLKILFLFSVWGSSTTIKSSSLSSKPLFVDRLVISEKQVMIVNRVFRLFFGHGVIYGREWLVLECQTVRRRRNIEPSHSRSAALFTRSISITRLES